MENSTDHRYTIEFFKDILKKCIRLPIPVYINLILPEYRRAYKGAANASLPI
jgi:hypothetical protein